MALRSGVASWLPISWGFFLDFASPWSSVAISLDFLSSLLIILVLSPELLSITLCCCVDTWMSIGERDHDIVELSVDFAGLSISVRGPTDSAARFVQHLGGLQASGYPTSPRTTRSAGAASSAPNFQSPSRASTTSTTTRSSILASFPPCPAQWTQAANSFLRGSKVPPCDRASRAWVAGCWAKAVIEGRVGTPNATPTIELGNRFWVVVKCEHCQVPRIFTSSARYFAAVGRIQGTDTVSQAFPSETEARIYLAAVGVEVESLD